MSDEKTSFYYGRPGSGKSYLLNNILNQIEETMDMSDFFNYLLSRRTDTPEVVIKSNLIDDGKEYVIGRPRTLTPVSPKKGNNMTSVEDGFINCACPAIMKHLMTSADSVFVIDELGYLESSCIPFQENIKSLLDNSRVLAVIRKQSTEFLDSIKSRSDVLLIDIDNTFSSISCIIMASGMSKRFGTNKLLASFNNNTLFENAINISHFVSFGKTLAVTRHDELVQICEREHIHCIKHNMPYRNDMVRPGLVLRTSLIVGLPGETEDEFAELCEFLQNVGIERVGVFEYSPEEGTEAAELPDQIDDETKQNRRLIVEELQSGVLDDYNTSRHGEVMQVLCEGFDEEQDLWYGRTYADSVEVDGHVYFDAADNEPAEGEFVSVLITESLGPDLLGVRQKEA